MNKFLDYNGLAYFWGKIKSWVTSRGYITSSGSITGNAATATEAESVPWNGVTGKPSTFTPSSHSHGNITNDGKLDTASCAVVTDGNKAIGVSSVTATELGYLSGATSNVQTQLNGKFGGGDTIPVANGGTGHGTQLVETTAANFNDFTESGDYHIGFPSGTANAPMISSSKLDCVLMVRKIGASSSVSSASRYTQIAIVQRATTSNQLKIFARKGFSDTGNWTAWSEIAFIEDVQTLLSTKADDSGVMHLTGDEIITGYNKTIKGGDKGWRCQSTNGSQELRFCVGSGGTNRGIWDVTLNKWCIKIDNTDCYLNGQVNSGSDERLKTKIEPMPDELLDAWDEINWNQFKYLAEVESRGEEDAAIHAGIVAQRVVEAFARHGLDAEKYGLIGRDVSEDGSDGFWMVRYLEALALEAACQRRRAERAEARIKSLEDRLSALEEKLA